MNGEDDDEIIAAVRDQSRRSMHTTFSWLAILAIAAGLGVHFYAPDIGITDQPEAIANSLLCMGVCYAGVLCIWDWLYA